jgi:hypothetical protein
VAAVCDGSNLSAQLDHGEKDSVLSISGGMRASRAKKS